MSIGIGTQFFYCQPNMLPEEHKSCTTACIASHEWTISSIDTKTEFLQEKSNRKSSIYVGTIISKIDQSIFPEKKVQILKVL